MLRAAGAIRSPCTRGVNRWTDDQRSSRNKPSLSKRQRGQARRAGSLARSVASSAPLEREQHPLDVAREQLDDAVPLLTGDPMTMAKVLVQESPKQEELEKLPDAELLRRAARALAVDVTVVGDAFLRQPQAIIQKPGELAVLFRALTACAQAASAAFTQAGNLKIGDTEDPRPHMT